MFNLRDYKFESLDQQKSFSETFSQFNASVSDEMDELIALRDAGGSVIPEVSFAQLTKTGFTSAQSKLIRQRGCVVVRDTFSQPQARQWNADLNDYLGGTNQYYQRLQNDIEAGDESRAKYPYLLDIYWSKTQIEIRQSARLQQLQQRLNGLWTSTKDGLGNFDAEHSCSYADRVRIRKPFDESRGIIPHVDSCSMELWFSQEAIDQGFKTLLQGHWQSYDAFNAVGRANTAAKPHDNSTGVFRTYQGWMALTPQGPGCGTLQLIPSSRCVAWLFMSMLRDSLNGVDADYPQPEPGQPYNPHPVAHKLLVKGLCSIPELDAGDTVWWHPEVVHAVEPINHSDGYSSAVFLGVAPDCKRNRDYLKAQIPCFLDGSSPPDFPDLHLERSYVGRATAEHLSKLGAQGMGYND